MAKGTSTAGAVCVGQVYVLRVLLWSCNVVTLAIMGWAWVGLTVYRLRAVVLCARAGERQSLQRECKDKQNCQPEVECAHH